MTLCQQEAQHSRKRPMTDCPAPHTAPRTPAAALACWFVLAAAGLALLPAGAALRSLWLAPWCEEAALRWGLQAPLAHRLGPRAAVWISALAFGLAHWLFARDGADAWIGTVFARSGRLAPCAAWHAGFNLLWLAVLRPSG
jgi:membrane protease YdiL (CAAX protease family)